MKFTWTKGGIEKLTWLTLEGVPVGDIAARLGCEMRTARKQQIELGLTGKLTRKSWTAAELALLRKLYPDTESSIIARKVSATIYQVYNAAHKMGLKKSAAFISAIGKKYLAPAGARTRFAPGQVPPNKGLRRPGWAPGRMAETQFKKGARSGKAAENWKPIGTIATDTEGFPRIKVREGKKGEAYGFGNTHIWPLLNRHIWEQHHGPIPPGHKIVFKDRNRANCAIENLEMVSSAELMRRNTIHRYPEELRNTIMLLGAAKRKIREASECQRIQ